MALPPYIDGFSERTLVGVTLKMTADFPRLPIDVEVVVYRIVQEALSNIARHSGSKTAEVEISQHWTDSRRRVHLSVTDFGLGIPSRTDERRSRLRPGGARIGLESMRERVDQIGGHLRVHSVPGNTRVAAVIPFGE